MFRKTLGISNIVLSLHHAIKHNKTFDKMITSQNTLGLTIQAIGLEMETIIELQQSGKASKDDLYNLAVLTHCLENLKQS